MLRELTVDNFETSIDSGVALVDFYADWCGPCKVLGKLMPHLAEKFDGKALIGKVNVDQQPTLTQKFWVSSMPTIIMFKNWQPVEQMRWLRPPHDYVDLVEKWLSDTTETNL